MPGEPGPQVIGPGHDQGPGLVDGLDPLGAGAALGDHQRPDRLHLPVPPFRPAARPAGLRRARRADRIQRIGLTRPAPVLPVGAVDLNNPDPSGRDVPGQPGTVTASPFDPDQAHSPEPAEPIQQAGVTGRGGRELLHAKQPANGVKGGSDVSVRVGIHTAGDGACLYDGQRHPFLWLRDGTHPLAARTCEPRPLAQARQIRPAAPVGARKPGSGRQIVNRTTRMASADSEVRPEPRPLTIPPRQINAGEAGPKAYPHPPCRLGASDLCMAFLIEHALIIQFGARLEAGAPAR